MPGSWDPALLPNLTAQNCAVASPATRAYNCIAWAANNDGRWWWPDATNMYYWPPNIPREITIDAFVQAYGTLGYVECTDATPEAGFEKIAIYAKRMPWGRYRANSCSSPIARWTMDEQARPFGGHNARNLCRCRWSCLRNERQVPQEAEISFNRVCDGRLTRIKAARLSQLTLCLLSRRSVARGGRASLSVALLRAAGQKSVVRHQCVLWMVTGPA
jgi:hypothetical protein